MQPVAIAEPPPLPREAPVKTPHFAAAGAVLAVIAARLMQDGALPAHSCPMFRWTGIPCPGCGGTRSLAACARCDLAAALFWNPLVALVAVAFVAWGALALADARLAEQVSMRVSRWLTPRRFAAVVALNWLYLGLTLPR